MNAASLIFDSVRFTRGNFTLEMNASFPAGRFTVILGPSGCGKTTALDLAAGFLQPAEGRILEGDIDVTRRPPEERKVGVVFQDNALFPHMSIRKNIMYGPRARGVSREAAARRTEDLLEMVRMGEYRSRRPASLSGGEKQRVALARALAIEPDILLLDEPFSALDAALRREMRGEVKRIQRATGITTVLVTHDQEEALALADNLVVMDRGRIASSGSPGDLWNTPGDLFTALFLGRSTRLGVSDAAEVPGGGFRLATSAGTLTLTASRISRDILSGSAGKPDPDSLVLVIRPEGMHLAENGPLSGRVSHVEYAGGIWRIEVEPPQPSEDDFIILEIPGSGIPPAIGDIVRFNPAESSISLLHKTREHSAPEQKHP